MAEPAPRLRAVRSADSWMAEERVRFLADALGGINALARLLGVANSQPSRWRQGLEAPSPGVARRILDLDHTMARLAQTMTHEQAQVWLESGEPLLGGARPIDVLRERGPLAIQDAIDAFEAGAFL